MNLEGGDKEGVGGCASPPPRHRSVEGRGAGGGDQDPLAWMWHRAQFLYYCRFGLTNSTNVSVNRILKNWQPPSDLCVFNIVALLCKRELSLMVRDAITKPLRVDYVSLHNSQLSFGVCVCVCVCASWGINKTTREMSNKERVVFPLLTNCVTNQFINPSIKRKSIAKHLDNWFIVRHSLCIHILQLLKCVKLWLPCVKSWTSVDFICRTESGLWTSDQGRQINLKNFLPPLLFNIQFSLFCISQYHKLPICLSGLFNPCTYFTSLTFDLSSDQEKHSRNRRKKLRKKGRNLQESNRGGQKKRCHVTRMTHHRVT